MVTTKCKIIKFEYPKKEQKIDLINDVVKFVSELNAIRYSGDTLIKTLARVLSKTFIEKQEYDQRMKLP